MLLDGDVVNKHDRVFHVTVGYGEVEVIEGNVCRVRMESGGVLNMGPNGIIGGMKLFFWYDPVIIVPRKGKQKLHRKVGIIASQIAESLEAGYD